VGGERPSTGGVDPSNGGRPKDDHLQLKVSSILRFLARGKVYTEEGKGVLRTIARRSVWGSNSKVREFH